MSWKKAQRKTKALQIQAATLMAQAQALQKEASEINGLRESSARHIEERATAVTERRETEKKLVQTTAERDTFLKEKEAAVTAKLEAEKKVELMRQKAADLETRMKDWETQRDESVKAAKASILEAGGQMSSKLIEDHKREAEAARKEAEEAAKKTTESLLTQVQSITESVAALKAQTGENRDKMETVWRALSSPAGAGQLAEVGLENTLKNLQLEPGRDFIMQYSVAGEENAQLRPDAVIFLPQDIVMVVDSKSTKYALEVAQVAGTPDESSALESLRKTMNTHFKTLYSKDYTAAVQNAYKQAGRGGKIRMTVSVMYVPSESMVDTIKRADPEFISKVERAGIILAGPASLSGLISLAGLNIGLARQAENQDAIVDSVQELMDSTVTVLGYADKLGRGLKSAADGFDAFARSVNGRMLPKLRKLMSLGVKPAKGRAMPGRIASYEVRLANDMLIEAEAETVEEIGVVEELPRKKISA